MKPRIAALLSIAGVLTAGSAAALVNTEVLTRDSGSGSAQPAPSSATSVTDPSSVPPSSPDPAAVQVAPVDPTATSSSTSIDRTTSTTGVGRSSAEARPNGVSGGGAPTPSAAVYQLGGAGTATLSTAGGVLRIVKVDPAAGWSVKDAKHEDAHNVEIRLRSDEREVRFEANLVFGVVSTSLRSDDG